MNEILWTQFQKERTLENSWVPLLRQKGWEFFTENGFPDRQDEDWKYTNLKELKGIPFHLAKRPDETVPSALQELLQKKKDCFLAVFLDGRFRSDLSTLPNSEKIVICPLSAFFSEKREKVSEYLNGTDSFKSHPFVALNNAFFEEGVFFHLSGKTTLEKPLEVIFFHSEQERNSAFHYRNIFLLEEGSEASLTQSVIGENSTPSCLNFFTEIFLSESSSLHYHLLQNGSPETFHFESTEIHQKKNSHLKVSTFTCAGKLVRNDLVCLLEGEGAEVELNGLYMASNSDQVDNHTRVEHRASHTFSQELYKGILNGSAEAVFNGHVLVKPNATKISSGQTNKNLLLSPHATINTKPLLEIYNDDVKCSHGATIGRLDENQVFYLRSRGLGEETSRYMLTAAFAGEITSKIKNDLFRKELEEKLTHFLSFSSANEVK